MISDNYNNITPLEFMIQITGVFNIIAVEGEAMSYHQKFYEISIDFQSEAKLKKYVCDIHVSPHARVCVPLTSLIEGSLSAFEWEVISS